MNPSLDLAALRAMLEDFFAGLPVQVYLFGSAARGALRRGSDPRRGGYCRRPLFRWACCPSYGSAWRNRTYCFGWT